MQLTCKYNNNAEVAPILIFKYILETFQIDILLDVSDKEVSIAPCPIVDLLDNPLNMYSILPGLKEN